MWYISIIKINKEVLIDNDEVVLNIESVFTVDQLILWPNKTSYYYLLY